MPPPKIRAPRRGLTHNSANLDASAAIICKSLELILALDTGNLSFEASYREVYRVVLSKKTAQLLEKVHVFIQDWLSREVRPDIVNLASVWAKSTKSSNTDHANRVEVGDVGQLLLLDELNRRWDRYNTSVLMISDVFLSADRIETSGVPKGSMKAFCRAIFQETILNAKIETAEEEYCSIEDILRHTIVVKQLEMERTGDIIDRHLMKLCVKIFYEVAEATDSTKEATSYVTGVESDVLKTSRDFYMTERTCWLRELGEKSFLRHVPKRVTEENRRCQAIFPQSTLPKVQQIVMEELRQQKMSESKG